MILPARRPPYCLFLFPPRRVRTSLLRSCLFGIGARGRASFSRGCLALLCTSLLLIFQLARHHQVPRHRSSPPLSMQFPCGCCHWTRPTSGSLVAPHSGSMGMYMNCCFGDGCLADEGPLGQQTRIGRQIASQPISHGGVFVISAEIARGDQEKDDC
jgi:hypothetical protein